MWSNRNTSSLLTGMQNGAAILEDNLSVSYTAKRILPYDRVIGLLGIYSIELKTFVHQNMHMKACNSYILIIHPKLQETELSCHGWINTSWKWQLFCRVRLCSPLVPPSTQFPGKNTGAGSHSFLQGIFLIQESNLSLLHWKQILYHLSHQRSWINRGTSKQWNIFSDKKKWASKPHKAMEET